MDSTSTSKNKLKCSLANKIIYKQINFKQANCSQQRGFYWFHHRIKFKGMLDLHLHIVQSHNHRMKWKNFKITLAKLNTQFKSMRIILSLRCRQMIGRRINKSNWLMITLKVNKNLMSVNCLSWKNNLTPL